MPTCDTPSAAAPTKCPHDRPQDHQRPPSPSAQRSAIALLAPAGTAAGIVTGLQQGSARALGNVALKVRLQARRANPGGIRSVDFARFIAAETASWARVVKASGATVD